MLPVDCQIAQIVDHIGARSQQAVADECQQTRDQCTCISHRVRRNQGNENQQVLQPLMHPHRPDPGIESGNRAGEYLAR